MIAVWRREFKVFQREISRVVASVVSPLMWLVLFGVGVGASMNVGSYQSFIFPGIIMMSVLFSSMFYGVYIIWDRKIDVLKAVLIAPVSRFSIFLGKVLGGCTDTLMQATVLLVIGIFLVSYTPLGFLLAVVIIFITAVGFVALGLTIGSLFESFEGFQLIGTFINFPLFFLSGALFPLDRPGLPGWLLIASRFNPLTYAVDGARYAMLGESAFPIYVDFAAVGIFSFTMLVLGSISFNRMK